eukprot:355922-Chlamydomonas_euryale.AAC.6
METRLSLYMHAHVIVHVCGKPPSLLIPISETYARPGCRARCRFPRLLCLHTLSALHTALTLTRNFANVHRDCWPRYKEHPLLAALQAPTAGCVASTHCWLRCKHLLLAALQTQTAGCIASTHCWPRCKYPPRLLAAPADAALGVNNALFGFAFVVFNFLSTATTPTVAAALAAGDRRRCGETVGQALALAAALGALVWVGLAANADTSLSLMGLDAASDPTLFASARSYLLLRAGAAPAALLVTVSQGVFRGLQDMRTPLAVTVATNTLHLGASLALVLPAGGLGLDGAALSTVGAEWAAAGTYLALVWRRREDLGLNPLPEVNPAVAWRAYGPFVASGGAVLMRTAVLLGTKTLASAVAARLGATSIASHQVWKGGMCGRAGVWCVAGRVVQSRGRGWERRRSRRTRCGQAGCVDGRGVWTGGRWVRGPKEGGRRRSILCAPGRCCTRCGSWRRQPLTPHLATPEPSTHDAPYVRAWQPGDRRADHGGGGAGRGRPGDSAAPDGPPAAGAADRRHKCGGASMRECSEGVQWRWHWARANRRQRLLQVRLHACARASAMTKCGEGSEGGQ